MAENQIEDEGSSTKEEQLLLVEQLQHLCLKDLITLYKTKEVTAQDRATVIRFLSQNGWVLDVSRLPKDLKKKLTANFRPSDDVDTPQLRIAR